MMLLRFGIRRLPAEAPSKDCRLGLRPQGVAHHRIAHRNDTAATARAAIQSAPKAAPPAGEIQDLGLGAGNGTRYGSREFKKAMQAPGMRHGFAWKRTPEQNVHVGSFRGTLRKECVWSHDFARLRGRSGKGPCGLQRGQDPLRAGLPYARLARLQVGGWE